MNNRRHQALLALLLVAMIGSAGCTTTRTVTASSPEALAERKIEVGDKVTVRHDSGRLESIKLTDIGQTCFSGTTRKGHSVELDYDHMLLLTYTQLDIRKIAATTITVIYIGAGLAGAGAAVPGLTAGY